MKGDWGTAGQRPVKPGGHEELLAHGPGRYAGKAIHVTAGHALSLQFHQAKEETSSCWSGRFAVEVGEHESSLEEFDLLPGESIHLRPGVRHRVTALVNSVFLEASTTQLDDVVRLEDKYGREGTSAP